MILDFLKWLLIWLGTAAALLLLLIVLAAWALSGHIDPS